jgi:hypothetical protein
LVFAETSEATMRKKFPREVLHSKAEWKKVNINMHGELEPPQLELSYLKGATHSAKAFELPDNLKSVNSQEIKEFIEHHKITKIMLSGQLENPGSENPHGFIEYEIDDGGMDIILYCVNGEPQTKHVTIRVEEVHHFNNHDNKWVYNELEDLIDTAGLIKRKVAAA